MKLKLYDILNTERSTSDIKSLGGGDMIFAGAEPDFGRFNNYGEKLFYRVADKNDYAIQDRTHFKINFSGDEIGFKTLDKPASIFSIGNRSLVRKQSQYPAYTDKQGNTVVDNWSVGGIAEINGNRLSFYSENERFLSTDLTSNGKKAIFGTSYNVYCTNTIGTKLWRIATEAEVWAVNISGNDKFVAATLGNGLINWYQMSDGKLLLSLFAHPDNERWVLFTPDGFFDCSPGAEELVGWHINQGLEKEAKFYPLSQFYEQYYTPNLGARILAGEEITTETTITENFKLPPEVNITKPKNNSKQNDRELIVNVEITDQGGGIDETRLYHNGKLVNNIQRGFKRIENEGKIISESFTINLVNGENYIKVTALNYQRTESLPDEIAVYYEGDLITPDLHMFIIGIDQYKNPKYHLNYAIEDAQAIRDLVNSNGESIFNEINVYFLKNEECIKENILSTFSEITSTSSLEDVFLFYYAGHGVMSEEEKSEFYIIPYDVIQLYGNNELLKTRAISASELQEYAKKIPAQKQLYIMDACQSGGMTEYLTMRGVAEEKAIAQLARSTGTYWLTSTNSEQLASEVKEIGHGIFTYALILGLQGEAERGTNDNKITVQELSSFLNDKVPELSEKHKGQAQYPNIYGYGQDFPIVVIK